MKDLLDKLSSYNLFNYLLPGTLFVAIAQRVSDHRFVQDNLVVSVFMYYFIGLVVSRIGSLFVEPIVKKLKFIEFADYKKYVSACKTDSKLELLSEQNNMFRTLAALFVALPAFKIVDWWVHRMELSKPVAMSMGSAIMLGLFLLAYRKQTEFVKKRIDCAK